MGFRIIAFDPNDRLCNYSFRKGEDEHIFCKKQNGDVCPQVYFCKNQNKWVFNANVDNCPLKRKE